MDRLQLEFSGKDDLPAWAILHYLQKTEINYIKLIIVQRICELIDEGISPDRFIVATSSADVFPEKTIEYADFKQFEFLARKEDSANDFWRIIKNHHRPVVFYESNGGYVPIYIRDENALTIKNIAVNSPVSINLEGGGKALADLYYANDREKRERWEFENQQRQNGLRFENEQIGQTIRNIEDIGRASETVNRRDVPEGVRVYANDILEQLLRRQEKLNEQIGMENTRISVRA